MMMAASDNTSDEDISQAVKRMWGALDRLAENDPDGYRKFIEQQMKEGKEQMCSPEPVFCLECDVTRNGVRVGGVEREGGGSSAGREGRREGGREKWRGGREGRKRR